MAVADLIGEFHPMHGNQQDDLQGLVDDIRERGLQEPPWVDQQGHILRGFRRVRACRKLGLQSITVMLCRKI